MYKRQVLAGTHLGYLPSHYAQPWVAAGQMRVLHPETLRYEVQHSMITHAGHARGEALKAFIADLLAEHGG